MATYRITGPDGHQYDITAPDDATQEQVLAYAQAQYAGAPAPAPGAGGGGGGGQQLPTTLENRMGTLKTISDYNNAIGRGAAAGFGDFALGLQSLAGKTVKAAGDVFAPPRTLSSLVTDQVPMNGVQKVGKWLVDDAEQGRKKLAAELAPYKEAHPLSAGGGEIAGNLALAVPATRMLGSAVATMGPPLRMAKVLTPLGESIATGGMRVGGPLAEAKGASAVAQRVATRTAGGAISGGATAGVLDPESAGTGAMIGGAMPLAIMGMFGLGKWGIDMTKKLFTSPSSKAADTILDAAGAKTPEQVAAVREALNTPRPSPIGEELTVPQILQLPGVSQLQRTLQNAGDKTLPARHATQEAQRMAALNRVSQIDGTTQQAAQRFGNELETWAGAANADAKKAVTDAYEAVDPTDVTLFRLPVAEMRGARDQYLGRGTFGTGKSAAQAIDTAEGMSVTRGRDPLTGAELAVDRLSPFREVQNLRSSIGEAAAAAQAKGANKEYAALSKMVKEIDDALDRVAAGRGSADEIFPRNVVDQWRRANDMHAERIARFETGPQRAMWRKGGDGQPVAQGGELAPKFFNSSRGQSADIASFNRLAGTDFPNDGLKNYAVTDFADQTAKFELSPTNVGNWVDRRSGAIEGLFNEGEQGVLKGVQDSLERSAKAEILGMATGSNTAQNANSLLNLGLWDSPWVNAAATRIPGVKHFATPMLKGLKDKAREAAVEEVAGLLSDPQALNEVLAARLVSRPAALPGPSSGVAQGLLYPAGHASVRAAPLLLTSP
jgi:hypothetical protein